MANQINAEAPRYRKPLDARHANVLPPMPRTLAAEGDVLELASTVLGAGQYQAVELFDARRIGSEHMPLAHADSGAQASFSVQRRGVKRWLLWAPGELPPAAVRAASNTGGMDGRSRLLPPPSAEVITQAGDALLVLFGVVHVVHNDGDDSLAISTTLTPASCAQLMVDAWYREASLAAVPSDFPLLEVMAAALACALWPAAPMQNARHHFDFAVAEATWLRQLRTAVFHLLRPLHSLCYEHGALIFYLCGDAGEPVPAYHPTVVDAQETLNRSGGLPIRSQYPVQGLLPQPREDASEHISNAEDQQQSNTPPAAFSAATGSLDIRMSWPNLQQKTCQVCQRRLRQPILLCSVCSYDSSCVICLQHHVGHLRSVQVTLRDDHAGFILHYLIQNLPNVGGFNKLH